MRLRLAALAVALLLVPATRAADPKPTEKPADAPQVFLGKVVPVTVKAGAKPAADGPALTLVTADGTTYTLVKDDASLALYLDPQLQNRPMRIAAQVLPNSQSLKVTKLQTVTNGKPHDFIYWCPNCALAATELGPCKCCGGETFLIETPATTK